MDKMLSYLSALEANNDREWYHANREWCREATGEFEELVSELVTHLRRMDDTIPPLEPRQITNKLTQDTRFSRDKSPYNPTFRAHISANGKLPIPVGYYLSVRPGDRSFLGGGLFTDLFTDATARIRDRIAAHGETWQKVISAPEFTARFTVRGAALKNIPRGYDAGHPQAEYLKHKSWYLEYPVPDRQLLEPGFPAGAAEVFAVMRPLNAFLNEALEGFEMPKR